MVDIQSAAAEIGEGKKKIEERNHRAKYNGLPYYIGTINTIKTENTFAVFNCQ